MSRERSNLAGRAVRKIHRLSLRFRERAAGLPIRASNRGLPLPPSRLIYLVGGSNDLAWFLAAGGQAAASIRDVLARNSIDINGLGAILDFGCGAGRVLRHWHDLPSTHVCGTDYNPRLVEWCRSRLTFAEVKQNGLSGRVGWGDGTFGLVYALSVFTHLTEPVGFGWIDELSRVVKPGGYLLITTHGDHYRDALSPEGRARYDSGEAVVLLPGREGTNHCATFHPPAYVRDRLARGLEVVDHIPEGALGNPRQDLWLLRKPA
jgi:SAM-dependent methyltransferase